jgi:hypothetical protein
VAGGDSRTTNFPQLPSSRGHARALRYALPALAGLLLLGVFIGIGARTPTPTTSGGSWVQHGTLVGLLTEVPLALLFVAVIIIGKRSLRQGYLAHAMRMMLQRLIALGMIVILLLVIVNSLHPYHPSRPGRQFFGRTRPRKFHFVKGSSADYPHLAWLPYLLLGLFAALLVAACVVLILRRRQHRTPNFYGVGDDGEELQRAVESGRSALRTVDNARAAIIACYLAMEASLAGAGTARGAAETPDELLERAAAAGIVHGGAAGRLTALFYEARYSTHPMPPSARESAREALDELSADLTIELAYAIRADGR